MYGAFYDKKNEPKKMTDAEKINSYHNQGCCSSLWDCIYNIFCPPENKEFLEQEEATRDYLHYK